MNKLIATTAAFAVLAGAALAQDVVRLGTEGAYPPYNFINDAGEIDGFERDFGDELCKRAGLNCEWVTNEWDSIIPNLVSSNYDVIIAGMSITAERDEVIDFAGPYTLPDPSSYVATSDSADLGGGIIAAQTGTIQAAHVASSGATLLEFATPEETIAAVRSGEADAVLADKSYLAPIVDAEADLTFVGEDILLGDGLGLGVRESDGDLKAKLDEVIAEMRCDGSLNDMISKWEVGIPFDPC